MARLHSLNVTPRHPRKLMMYLRWYRSIFVRNEIDRRHLLLRAIRDDVIPAFRRLVLHHGEPLLSLRVRHVENSNFRASLQYIWPAPWKAVSAWVRRGGMACGAERGCYMGLEGAKGVGCRGVADGNGVGWKRLHRSRRLIDPHASSLGQNSCAQKHKFAHSALFPLFLPCL
jgi:hypothetical protein